MMRPAIDRLTAVDPIDFSSREFQADPWPIYRQLRAGDPVYWSQNMHAFVIFRHADIAGALADRRLATDFPMRKSRRLFGSTMLDADGLKHRRMRQGLTPVFGNRAVANLANELILPVIAHILDTVGDACEVDFIEQVAVPVPYGVITRLLGLPPGDATWLRQRVTPLAEAIDFPSGSLEMAHIAKDQLVDYLTPLMAARKKSSGNQTTLLDLLVRQGWSDTDPDLLSTVILFLLAGTETSVSVISTIMHTLLEHGVDQEDWTNADFRRAAIRETLRWEPPTHTVLRYAVTDMDIRGVRIPRHSAVLLSLASGNRDEDVFADAERWRPGRGEQKSLAFGAGPHTCLGIHLALTEFDILFDQLGRRYADIRLTGEPISMHGHAFRGPERLVLRWTRQVSRK